MPLAAAPYRASGLVPWHKTDMLGTAVKVRYRGQSGPDLSGRSLGRVNLAHIVGDAAAAARLPKANGQCAAHQCHLVECAGRAHHQPEAVVLDFVNPEISAAFLFNALRFWVAVSSDFSGCSCVLKVLFSKTSRRR